MLRRAALLCTSLKSPAPYPLGRFINARAPAHSVMSMMMDVTELQMDAVEALAKRLEKFGALVELRNEGGRIRLIC